MYDMKSGARGGIPHFSASDLMLNVARQVSESDIEASARYFSRLKFRKQVRVVESATVPHYILNGVYLFDDAGPREPIGERILEGPDDVARFELRDPHMTYTAYVPPGAVARGAALAKDRGAGVNCTSCHGARLKGSAIAPPIAGRSPTPMVRQLYAFKTGIRKGPGAVSMEPVVAGLLQNDMIDLAAYVASLEP
jgi:cytochrome c553